MTFNQKDPFPDQKINRIYSFKTVPADIEKIEIPFNKKILISATHNKVGIINKLVTIFASYPQTIYMLIKTSDTQLNLLAAGGKDCLKTRLITCTWMAKIAP